MEGDKSDNLKGINGIGMKTVRKRLPFMREEKSYDVDEVVQYSIERPNQLSCYKKIIAGKELIKTNYDIMQLYKPNISMSARSSINFALTQFEPTFEKLNVTTMLMEDGQTNYDFNFLWLMMKKIKR